MQGVRIRSGGVGPVNAAPGVSTEARKALGAPPFTSFVLAAGSRQINEIYIIHEIVGRH